jgi:hypothetical protein
LEIRLFKTLRRTFPFAEIKIVDGDILEIGWLAPSPPIIADPKEPGERQECTLVCYCVAWPSPFGIRLCSAWSLSVEDHAAGRYLQREGEDADFKNALFAAANHFYSADAAEVAPHVGVNTDVYLPAKGGAFICTVVGARSSGGNRFLYARAATWVEEEKLYTDQIPLPKARSEEESVAALLLDP